MGRRVGPRGTRQWHSRLSPFFVVEHGARRAAQSVSVHPNYEGDLTPPHEPPRRPIGGHLDELALIPSATGVHTPAPVLSLVFGSPASGLDCSIVPSEWKMSMW